MFLSFTQPLPRKDICELDKLGHLEAQWALAMIHLSFNMMANEMPWRDNGLRACLEQTHLAVILRRANTV